MNRPFSRGERVRKIKGYIFEGVVLSVYPIDYDWRVDVQLVTVPPGGNGHGMIHIFAPDQLERGWKIQQEPLP